MWLLLALVSGQECTEFEVLSNGANEGVLVPLTPAICSSRAAIEAAVSLAVCETGAQCEARDGAGRLIYSCDDIRALPGSGVQASVVPKVYGVRRDRRFVFATEEVGFTRHLPHINISLRTLALKPRLFEVEGFLTEADADSLIEDALAISDDEHKLMRSSTGPSGYNPSDVRTSENAWVKDTTTAKTLKHRAFQMLGFEQYDERMADGLQVLRYNSSNAYIAHTDYLSRPKGVSKEAMDPAVGGANRLATVLLYLSDVRAGGQTVFPQVERSHDDVALETNEKDTRLQDQVTPSGWQHAMVDDCYSKLAVKPKKARAVLYYSQLPDGTLDPLSRHGGCPVLAGQKWAANLWVWNKPMPFGSSRFSAAAAAQKTATTELAVSFRYSGTRDDVSLYWNNDVKMGDFRPPLNSLSINTYLAHSFTVKTDTGLELATFKIEPGKTNYECNDSR